MSDYHAKERRRMYERHVRHSKIWKYKPMDWHAWKFIFWPRVSSSHFEMSQEDIVFEAAKKQNAVKLFGTQKLIDPPEGWKYGFPKKLPLSINPDNMVDLKEWLIENGYPSSLISDKFRCRVWEEV